MDDQVRRAIIEGRRHVRTADAEPAPSTSVGETRHMRWTDPEPGKVQLLYTSSLFGGPRFSGMELVHAGDRPVWSMSYAGGMDRGQEMLTTKTYAFLRKALLARAESARLPNTQDDRFVSGRWMYRYHYEPSGSAAFSLGREYIIYRGRSPDFEGVSSVYDAVFIFNDLVGEGR